MDDDYNRLTIKNLQNIAKERGLKKYSRLSKENLIEVLRGRANISDFSVNVRGSDQDLSRQTIRGLQDIAKERGLKKYSRLSKENLIEVLRGRANISDFSVNVRGSDQDLSRQTIRGLQDIAKERGLKKYSRLSKENLIEVLSGRRELVNEPKERKKTVKDLKKIARDNGYKGYSQLTKKQLNQVLNGERKIENITHITPDIDLKHLLKNNLKKVSQKALREIAKKQGYRNYSKRNKEDLIDRLVNSDKGSFSMKQLRRFAAYNENATDFKKYKSAGELFKYLCRVFWKEIEIKLVGSALDGKVRIYKGFAPPWDSEKDGYPCEIDMLNSTCILMSIFLENMREQMVKILSDNIERKVKMNVEAVLIVEDKEGDMMEELHRFYSDGNEIVSRETDFNALYDKMGNMVLKNLYEYIKKSSGWRLRNITEIMLKSAIYDPLKANGHLPLPEWIRNKGVVINIQNKDEKCFFMEYFKTFKSRT